MAIAMTELVTSQEGYIDLKGAEITTRWLASGDTSFANIYGYASTFLPPLFNSLWLLKIQLRPRGVGLWEVDAVYGIPDSTDVDNDNVDNPPTDPPLGPEYSFDTTAATVHVNQSLNTVTSVGAGGVAPPNNRKAIGLTREKVEGVDVYAGKLEFTLTVNWPFLGMTYLRNLRTLTATTNAPVTNNAGVNINGGYWYQWQPYELLFLGASGQFRQENGWQITYKFAAGQNLAAGDPALVISPDITLPSKYAWDYVWVGYGDAVDTNVLIQKPLYAYVEQVYKSSDFRKLGLGY